jgi:hypothetical protein
MLSATVRKITADRLVHVGRMPLALAYCKAASVNLSLSSVDVMLHSSKCATEQRALVPSAAVAHYIRLSNCPQASPLSDRIGNSTPQMSVITPHSWSSTHQVESSDPFKLNLVSRTLSARLQSLGMDAPHNGIVLEGNGHSRPGIFGQVRPNCWVNKYA